MFERIKPFVKKELRQIARDRRVLGMLLLIPAFLLVMFGYALNFDVKHLNLAIFDQENSLHSRDFYERFLHSEYFDFRYSPRNLTEIDRLMAEGKIQLAIEVRDFSFRGFLQGNRTTAIKEITVDLKPPTVELLHAERYITPGGTGMAVYRISEPDCTHGVMLNGHLNPGYPLGADRPNTYVAFFTLPYDAENLSEAQINVSDRAGNAISIAFSPVYQKITQKHDRINISDGFLSAKIPEFEQHYPEMQGSPVEKYLYANNAVRDANNTTISEVCRKSTPERLWKGKFLRMLGSPKAGFADHRTYFYQEKEIDKQVHLGVDIASTERIGIQAANTGKVVFAEYLGIYGNCVILDHGQGIFSLYSHMSQINAAVGDKVEKGKVIGLTGTSGMAGGDHLHFSMLVNGVFAMPKEWWDEHWIEVNIDDPLAESKI
jgi:murein DD-endopeptidase MepM/ murein hydrolase activator NlpD